MRLLRSVILPTMPTAFVMFAFSHAFTTAAAAQAAASPDVSWTPNQPLTGRAIPCQDGRINGFVCQNVELLSFLPIGLIGQSSGYDLWGWHDSSTGREFVVIGGEATAFIEVTDPVNPVYLGLLPPHAGVMAHGAQSVKVYRGHAFIAYEGSENGLQVFDLTRLRDVKNPPAVFRETAHYDDFGRAHTLAVNEQTGFLYAAATRTGQETCGGGLHIVDVRSPAKPVFAGCHHNPVVGRGYVHDTQCVLYHGRDKRYRGREICINAAETALEIVDMTDKWRPKTISTFTYPNVGYAHQGWLTKDHRYFFLDDEADESNPTTFVSGNPDPSKRVPFTRTIVFSMDDLDDPVVVKEYFATTTGTDHNLYIRGRYMYQGNMTDGLRIIDVAEPAEPKEVGYLTKVGWAWGTYTFLKDEVVAVSMNIGLILARRR